LAQAILAQGLIARTGHACIMAPWLQSDRSRWQPKYSAQHRDGKCSTLALLGDFHTELMGELTAKLDVHVNTLNNALVLFKDRGAPLPRQLSSQLRKLDNMYKIARHLDVKLLDGIISEVRRTVSDFNVKDNAQGKDGSFQDQQPLTFADVHLETLAAEASDTIFPDTTVNVKARIQFEEEIITLDDLPIGPSDIIEAVPPDLPVLPEAVQSPDLPAVREAVQLPDQPVHEAVQSPALPAVHEADSPESSGSGWQQCKPRAKRTSTLQKVITADALCFDDVTIYLDPKYPKPRSRAQLFQMLDFIAKSDMFCNCKERKKWDRICRHVIKNT